MNLNSETEGTTNVNDFRYDKNLRIKIKNQIDADLGHCHIESPLDY